MARSPAMALPDDVRRACARVAGASGHVRIVESAIGREKRVFGLHKSFS